jgi:ribA/ribD-fused uncharacterized protein
MEFDQTEFTMIMESDTYKKEVEESRARAIAHQNYTVNDNVVEFYGRDKGNGDTHGRWFSNCFCAVIEINGSKHLSSEHYYQKRKFDISCTDPTVVIWCKERKVPVDVQLANNKMIMEQMSTMSPVQVAQFGQQCRNAPIRGDWEQIKKQTMYDALMAKFTQNLEFAEALKSTGEAVLIERAPTDSIWAINNNGKGSNWLGVMLMMVRSLLE